MNLDDILAKIQYTPGDLVKEHDAISGIMINKNKEILMLDHVKYNFWTIPIGKVEPNQTIEQGLKQEMLEELNITPTRIKKIHQFKRSYRRRGDKITVHAHMFLITRWSGSLRNNEPKKHRTIKWMSIKEIKQQRISDNTKEMLRILKNGKRLS